MLLGAEVARANVLDVESRGASSVAPEVAVPVPASRADGGPAAKGGTPAWVLALASAAAAIAVRILSGRRPPKS